MSAEKLKGVIAVFMDNANDGDWKNLKCIYNDQTKEGRGDLLEYVN